MLVRSPMQPRRVLRLALAVLLALLAAAPFGALPSAASQDEFSCTLTRVALPDGVSAPRAPAVSGDGSAVSFNVTQVLESGFGISEQSYLVRFPSLELELISAGQAGEPVEDSGYYASHTAISADGRYVAFVSEAHELVPGIPGGYPLVYLRDTQAGSVELVSQASGGVPPDDAAWTPAITPDGNIIVFQSPATNLVETWLLSDQSPMDVWLYDRQAEQTELVSISTNGERGADLHDYGWSNLAISADGNIIAFPYWNLANSAGEVRSGIFVRNRSEGWTRFLAPGENPDLSPDARWLVFDTDEAILPEDTSAGKDVYLWDRVDRVFELISVDSAGEQWYRASYPSVSGDGRYIVFQASAGETEPSQVYLRDRQTGQTHLISAAPGGQPGSGDSSAADIASDGSLIAFTSTATDLDPAGPTELLQLYLCALPTTPVTYDYFLYFPIVGNGEPSAPAP